MKKYQFECVEPDHAEYEDYSSRFESYNREKSGWSIETFSIVKRNDEAIIAGGRGYIYLGALEIRGLWVDESIRGNGIGSVLLSAIEDEARTREATKAMLYTYFGKMKDSTKLTATENLGGSNSQQVTTELIWRKACE